MSILNPRGKKGDKKNTPAKNGAPASKFITTKGAAKGPAGVSKKPLTGGTQRGS